MTAGICCVTGWWTWTDWVLTYVSLPSTPLSNSNSVAKMVWYPQLATVSGVQPPMSYAFLAFHHRFSLSKWLCVVGITFVSDIFKRFHPDETRSLFWFLSSSLFSNFPPSIFKQLESHTISVKKKPYVVSFPVLNDGFYFPYLTAPAISYALKAWSPRIEYSLRFPHREFSQSSVHLHFLARFVFRFSALVWCPAPYKPV